MPRIRALVTALPPAARRTDADQIIRAAKSIRNNIAEGAGLNTDPLFAKHLRHALGSANEVQDQLLDLDDEGYLRESDQDLLGEVAEIRSMIAGLMRVVTGEVPPKCQRKPKPPKKQDASPATPKRKTPSATADGESEFSDS